jgi:hypothetical protein
MDALFGMDDVGGRREKPEAADMSGFRDDASLSSGGATGSKAVAGFCLAVWMGFPHPATGTVPEGSRPGSVRFTLLDDEPERIELEARQVPLSRILDTVAHRLGIPIHYSILPTEPVDATCLGETVKEIMDCLLGPKANLVFRYPSGFSRGKETGQPVELWVLGGSVAEPPPPSAQTECGTVGGKDERAAKAVVVDPELTEKLLHMARSEDPVERIGALSQLAGARSVDPGVAEKILQAALNDPDPDVRGQAIYALAQRGGGEASALLHEALKDSAPSVRLLAVDGLGSDAESLAWLRQALRDDDEAVRELAAMKLEMLGMEVDDEIR